MSKYTEVVFLANPAWELLFTSSVVGQKATLQLKESSEKLHFLSDANEAYRFTQTDPLT